MPVYFDAQLETAIGYAKLAGDMNSLAALARSESVSANRWRHMLAAVLAKTGPVTLDEAEVIKERRIEWVSTEYGKKVTLRVEE